MNALGLNTYIAQENFASVVRVTSNGHSVELPAFMQPGQKPGTIAVALGYGEVLMVKTSVKLHTKLERTATTLRVLTVFQCLLVLTLSHSTSRQLRCYY